MKPTTPPLPEPNSPRWFHYALLIVSFVYAIVLLILGK